MIRVVTFDAANTLIRLTMPASQTYADVARRFGAALDPARLHQAFLQAWKEVPRLPDQTGPRSDDGRSWWRDLVATTLSLAEYRIDPFPAYFDAVYEEFKRPGVWQLTPGITEVLDTLAKAAIRLGILSNFDQRLYAILKTLGVLDRFEHVIISSEVGTEKPSPRIFAEVLRRFQVGPKEVLHVGDDEKLDGNGARSAGMSAFILGKDGGWKEFFRNFSLLAESGSDLG
ncbi:MAG TPA: HAD-IA family hydrolase [Chthoniobacterales bacterium]|nr:HAD-IA family hydrolase [Chthoniobacterales bacterium]